MRTELALARRRAYCRQWRLNHLQEVRAYDIAKKAERWEFINWIKLGLGCQDCGYAVYPEALDFDHVRGTKIRDVSKMLTCSPDALQTEAMKCEIVCSNCHRHRTTERGKSYGVRSVG